MNKIFEQSVVHSLCDSVIEFESCYMPIDDSIISKQKLDHQMCAEESFVNYIVIHQHNLFSVILTTIFRDWVSFNSNPVLIRFSSRCMQRAVYNYQTTKFQNLQLITEKNLETYRQNFPVKFMLLSVNIQQIKFQTAYRKPVVGACQVR